MSNSKLFRLHFGAVHFGDDGLGASTVSCKADTLFSALCISALRAGGEVVLAQLLAAVTKGELRFTDLLPFVGDTYLVPKPIMAVHVNAKSAAESNTAKKQAKRIAYVPISQLPGFLSGASDLEQLANLQNEIGVGELTDHATIHNGKVDAEPFKVGTFRFANNSGLWLLAQGSVSELAILTRLLEQTSALGGERSSGYGSFNLEQVPAIPAAITAITAHPAGSAMLLTTAIPDDAELDQVLPGATYQLVRRSGFVASPSFAETPRRKRDIYKFAAGSVTQPFNGVVLDVAIGGSHPVWSYAKPLFLPLPPGLLTPEGIE